MRFIVATIALLLINTVPASAQPVECQTPPADHEVSNPTGVCFQVPADHPNIDNYVLDIIDDQGGLVNTIDLGKPAPDGNGWVYYNQLNVMPQSFGSYTSFVRSVAGGVSSVNSNESSIWDRIPGPPGGHHIVAGLGKTWGGMKWVGRGFKKTPKGIVSFLT